MRVDTLSQESRIVINPIPIFSPSFLCHNRAAKHISISEASVCDEVLISDGADRKAPECSLISQGSNEKEKTAEIIRQGEQLARKVVNKNIHSVKINGGSRPYQVLTAGSDHFKALWTRDASYCTIGLINDGKPMPALTDTIQAILNQATPEGVLPNRQGDFYNGFMIAASALHIPVPDCKELEHVEHSNVLGALQYDANALPVVAASLYVTRTGDMEFLRKNYEVLSRATDLLEKKATSPSGVSLVGYDREQSIREPFVIVQQGSGDWKDALKRHGVVAYTNVVTYQAVKSMAALDRLMGNEKRGEEREQFAAKMKEDFNRLLWDDHLGFYRDSLDTDLFSPDGNILAILFGIASPEQSSSILDRCEELEKKNPLPFPAAEKEYPESYKPLWMKVSGMKNYHDLMVWTWQGSAYALAALQCGRVDAAERVLGKIAKKAVEDGTFYEVYTPGKDPRPVNKLLYHSEPDFLWSAGMFIWAAGKLDKAQKAY